MAGEQESVIRYTLVDTSDLTSIANAIRNKRGSSNTIAVSEMATNINAINTTMGSVSGYQATYNNSGINTLVSGKLDATTHSRFYGVPLNQILSLTVYPISDTMESVSVCATTFAARDIQYAFNNNYPVITGTSINQNGLQSYYWQSSVTGSPVPILVLDSNNVTITKTSTLGEACIFQNGAGTPIPRANTYPYSNYIIACRLLIEYSNKPLW